MMRSQLLGAVEAGGTKFRAAVVAVGEDSGDGDSGSGHSSNLKIIDSILVPTSDPETTLAEVVSFFAAREPVAALGIASFGPVDLDTASPDYGAIADTPKPQWSGVRILDRLAHALEVPAGIQTDVEAAAVAEQMLGTSPYPKQLAYVTVGTGVGAAVAAHGVPLRGYCHSELGHIPVRRIAGDDYPGHCPFHQDCLEGMACGPAVAQRWGIDLNNAADAAADRDDIWQLEAGYLAQLVRMLCYSFAPERIVFGGGVGKRSGMADMIRAASVTELAGYADYSTGLSEFVVAPALGNDSGLLGAALLAQAQLHP